MCITALALICHTCNSLGASCTAMSRAASVARAPPNECPVRLMRADAFTAPEVKSPCAHASRDQLLQLPCLLLFDQCLANASSWQAQRVLCALTFNCHSCLQLPMYSNQIPHQRTSRKSSTWCLRPLDVQAS